MTRDEVAEATLEAIDASERLAAHPERLITRLSGRFPLDAGTVAGWDDDPRERLHALLRMFDQLYDLASRKLIRGFLFLSGEKIDGLLAQNQFRRVESLGAVSADRWIEIGATRNALAHDYPPNPAAQA